MGATTIQKVAQPPPENLKTKPHYHQLKIPLATTAQKKISVIMEYGLLGNRHIQGLLTIPVPR